MTQQKLLLSIITIKGTLRIHPWRKGFSLRIEGRSGRSFFMWSGSRRVAREKSGGAVFYKEGEGLGDFRTTRPKREMTTARYVTETTTDISEISLS